MSHAEEIARVRYERDDFKRRASAKRKEWLQARKERRWLDALLHKDREQEYRRSADERQGYLDRLSPAKSASK